VVRLVVLFWGCGFFVVVGVGCCCDRHVASYDCDDDFEGGDEEEWDGEVECVWRLFVWCFGCFFVWVCCWGVCLGRAVR
jgi:hypothetical protein